MKKLMLQKTKCLTVTRFDEFSRISIDDSENDLTLSLEKASNLASGTYLRWTKEEDRMLLKLRKKNPDSSWGVISKLFPGKNSKQCSYRYRKITITSKKRSQFFHSSVWRHDESIKLQKLINHYGLKFKTISSYFNGKKTENEIRSQYKFFLNEAQQSFTEDTDQSLKIAYNSGVLDDKTQIILDKFGILPVKQRIVTLLNQESTEEYSDKKLQKIVSQKGYKLINYVKESKMPENCCPDLMNKNIVIENPLTQESEFPQFSQIEEKSANDLNAWFQKVSSELSTDQFSFSCSNSNLSQDNSFLGASSNILHLLEENNFFLTEPLPEFQEGDLFHNNSYMKEENNISRECISNFNINNTEALEIVKQKRFTLQGIYNELHRCQMMLNSSIISNASFQSSQKAAFKSYSKIIENLELSERTLANEVEGLLNSPNLVSCEKPGIPCNNIKTLDEHSSIAFQLFNSIKCLSNLISIGRLKFKLAQQYIRLNPPANESNLK